MAVHQMSTQNDTDFFAADKQRALAPNKAS